MKKSSGVGILGFGTVGEGLIKILNKNSSLINERLGCPLEIRAVVDKELTAPRQVSIDKGLLSTDVKTVLENPQVDIVVELIGGLEPARTFVLSAIRGGKSVVTANKALIAECGQEIFSEAKKHNVEVYFEASVGGAIPVVKTLRESLCANRIQSVLAIINGTCNYILSEMSAHGQTFEESLKQAKAVGYTEEDPGIDIDGTDSANKLAIIAGLAFGARVRPEEVYTEGIGRVTVRDMQYGDEFGYTLKLLAIGKLAEGELELRVHPTFIPKGHLLSSVNGVFNACYIKGDAAGEIMLYGYGAGALPAGSAVAGDIVDAACSLRQGSARGTPYFPACELKRIKTEEEISSCYYVRFSAIDKPGILAEISGILGKHNISIASVIQKGRRGGDTVPIVMMTHTAREKNITEALSEINSLEIIKSASVLIRIEK